MATYVLALIAVLALAMLWELLRAGGWPAWVALLAGATAFGAAPTEPLRAVIVSAAVFAGLSLLRRL